MSTEHLPEQLRKQAESADKTIKEFYGTGEKSNSAAQDPATAAQASEPVAQPTQAAVAPQAAEEAAFKQRYLSLQGMYNRVLQDNGQLKQRLDGLEHLLSQMQQPPAQPAPTITDKPFLTDKDWEEYGGEMVDTMLRAAREENRELVQTIVALNQRLERLEGNVRQVVPAVNHVMTEQSKTKGERFFENLAKQVPDWERVNNLVEFRTWCLSPDPITGTLRQTSLEKAHTDGDADWAARIFNEWKRAAGANPPTPNNPTTPDKKPNAVRNELEAQIAPGRGGGNPPPNQDQKKIWTAESIKKFYDDKRRGLFIGKEQEASAMERDIFAAQREGRYQPNAA